MARDVSFVFDPFEIAGVDKDTIRPSERERVLSEVSDYVINQVLIDTSKGISAVYGDSWDPLSDDYKKFKKKEGKGSKANLEFCGDLLEAVKITTESDDTIKIYVSKSQSDKADGHNNHSGESQLPLRRFIPGPDDSGWRDGINKKIKSIVNNAETVDTTDAQNLFETALNELTKQGAKKTLKGE